MSANTYSKETSINTISGFKTSQDKGIGLPVFKYSNMARDAD
jgi:hypothetical protein